MSKFKKWTGSPNRVTSLDDTNSFQKELAASAMKARCRSEDACKFHEKGADCRAIRWYPRAHPDPKRCRPLVNVSDWCPGDQHCRGLCDSVWPWKEVSACVNGMMEMKRDAAGLKIDRTEADLFANCPETAEEPCVDAAIRGDGSTPETDPEDATVMAHWDVGFLVGMVILVLAVAVGTAIVVVNVQKNRRNQTNVDESERPSTPKSQKSQVQISVKEDELGTETFESIKDTPKSTGSEKSSSKPLLESKVSKSVKTAPDLKKTTTSTSVLVKKKEAATAKSVSVKKKQVVTAKKSVNGLVKNV